MPYNNPTQKLAGEARASYDKVARAQEQRTAIGENQLNRQQQGIAQGAGMMQQQSQFEEQLGQRQQQFEAAQEQEQQQFESAQQQRQSEQAQQNEQFRQRQQLAVEQFREEQAVNMDRQQQFRAELDLQNKKLQIEEQKIQTERAKLQQKAEAEQIERMDKKRTGYTERRDKLRSARDKLLTGSQTETLDQVGMMIDKNAPDLKDNKEFQAAFQKAAKGDPQAVQKAIEAIDNAIVYSLVQQAGEMGEWNPSPSLMTHPEVQQFNAYMANAKQAMNAQLRDVMLGLATDPKAANDYLKMMGPPEERDRRLVRTAYHQMRAFYRARQLRSGIQTLQQQGQNVQPGDVGLPR